jgi:hypothetical protein
MITVSETTDATAIYRETTALSTVRMDGTNHAGSLFEAMRDTVVVISSSSICTFEEKFPEQPQGGIEALFRG